MKKLTIVLFLIFFINMIILWIVINMHLYLFNPEKIEKETIKSYKSFDESYTLQLLIEEDIQTHMYYDNMIIIENITGKKVFSIKNEYRDFDFQWVVWEKENYNFWIKSGDLGTFCYEFQGDEKTWIKYKLEIDNKGNYILFADEKNVKAINFEYILQRLPNGMELN